MIALTQEKREELANYARARLASHVVHGGCSDEEDIFKIALAALTAESIAHADSKAILKMIKGHTRFFTSFPERSETKRVGLFIAPPVPEIKFPEEEDCESGLEKHGLKMKAEGISQLSDGFRCGFAWHEHEIKRINGLGD